MKATWIINANFVDVLFQKCNNHGTSVISDHQIALIDISLHDAQICAWNPENQNAWNSPHTKETTVAEVTSSPLMPQVHCLDSATMDGKQENLNGTLL